MAGTALINRRKRRYDERSAAPTAPPGPVLLEELERRFDELERRFSQLTDEHQDLQKRYDQLQVKSRK